MKNYGMAILFMALTCVTPTTLMAQHKADKSNAEKVRLTPEQRMERQTVNMAHELMLNDAVSQKFCTLYQKYLTELHTCQDVFRKDDTLQMSKGMSGQLTDAQIEKKLEARFVHARRILDIREKYYHEFKKILTPRQIQRMYRAEKSLQRKVHKEMERRNGKLRVKGGR